MQETLISLCSGRGGSRRAWTAVIQENSQDSYPKIPNVSLFKNFFLNKKSPLTAPIVHERTSERKTQSADLRAGWGSPRLPAHRCGAGVPGCPSSAVLRVPLPRGGLLALPGELAPFCVALSPSAS